MNALNQIRLEVKTSYESLHLLLDREVLVRRQIDLMLDDLESFDQSPKATTKWHECEGFTHPVTRAFQEIRFRSCNMLCRLKKESRDQLLKLEETLG